MNFNSKICYLIKFFFALLMTSCTTSSDVGYVWLGTGVDNDWGTGGEIWSHTSTFSPQRVTQVGNDYCAKRNLANPILQPSIRQGEFYTYKFECSKPPPTINQSSTQLPSVNSTIKSTSSLLFEEAKLKCAEIGFQSGTEAFGKCVLKLTD